MGLKDLLGKEKETGDKEEQKTSADIILDRIEENGDTPTEAIENISYEFFEAWGDVTSIMLNEEAAPRYYGQGQKKGNELYKELEDEDLFVNPGVVRHSVNDTLEEKMQPFIEDYFEENQEFLEKLREFGKEYYSETEDLRSTVEMLEYIGKEAHRRKVTDIDIYPEAAVDEFFELRHADSRRKQAFRNLYHLNVPEKEVMRENIPEIPMEAMENFQALFGQEGPLEVYEQRKIQDYQ